MHTLKCIASSLVHTCAFSADLHPPAAACLSWVVPCGDDELQLCSHLLDLHPSAAAHKLCKLGQVTPPFYSSVSLAVKKWGKKSLL